MCISTRPPVRMIMLMCISTRRACRSSSSLASVSSRQLPPRTGDRTADIEAGVRMINAFMEERIRERPAEWFWVHRRWPNAVYAELAERERAAMEKAGEG